MSDPTAFRRRDTTEERMMAYTAHVDAFARENLPPRDQWPDLVFSRPELQYPERVNCAAEFLDRWVEEGRGDKEEEGTENEFSLRLHAAFLSELRRSVNGEASGGRSAGI